MKVKKSEFVALMLELGFQTVGKWNMERLNSKIKVLPELITEGKKVEDNKDLCKKILAAIKAKEDVSVVDDSDKKGKKEKEAPAKAEKTAKKGKKAKEPEPEEDEDEEDEDEDEDEDSEDEDSDEEDEDEDSDEEEEEPAPKKGKKSAKKAAKEEDEDEEDEDEDEDEDEEDEDEEEEAPKKKKDKKEHALKGKRPESAGKDGKPGIIASILEFLQAASEEKPISKEKILAKLVKRFPERAAESMSKTVNVQVPNRIKNDKGLNVVKNDDGYWIDASKKAKKKAKPAKEEDDSDDDE